MSINVDDSVCRKINELAKIFYSDPKNVQEFEQWKLKKYGNGGNNEANKAGN